MNRSIKRVVAFAILAVLVLCTVAIAEGRVSTTLIMRVSKMTQSAVVNVGEDLSMQVLVDGVEPDLYQWYYADTAIPGANSNVFSIVNAAVEDAGVYRMEAYDADGAMLVKTDIYARVIDAGVPKSGDDSMPVGYAFAALAAAMTVLFFATRRRNA